MMSDTISLQVPHCDNISNFQPDIPTSIQSGLTSSPQSDIAYSPQSDIAYPPQSDITCSQPNVATQPQPAITSQNYNYLRCWFALINYGKEVFHTIFSWGFPRPPIDIKDALFDNPSYSKKKYRSDFDSSQRAKIEQGAINEFDISLFYLLLQRICAPLPGPSDKTWGREAGCDSLPSLLYQIKMLRNTMAHAHVNITERMMNEELNSMDAIFTKALDLAGQIFNISPEEATASKEKVSAQILSIKSVDSSTIDQLRKNAELKQILAIEEAKQELTRQYECLSQVLIAPWTVVESFQNINDIFTDPLLKHNKNNVLFQQLDEKESFIHVSEILVSRLNDNSLPNFVLLVSKSGMGKTTLTKFIIQSWIEKNQRIKGMEDLDLVFYMDCRFARCSSFAEFLAEIVPNTVHLFGKSELKLLISTMKVLVILDNIDELKQEAISSYEEILKMNTQRFRILATSTQNLTSSFSRPHQQKHLLLDLAGFSPQNISTCVSKIYTTIFGNQSLDENDLNRFCSAYKVQTTENTRSPEVLCHIFFHWLMHNKKDTTYATKTQIFCITHELLCLKLMEKVGVNVPNMLVERKNINDRIVKFFSLVFEEAFNMFIRCEHEISSNIFEKFKRECQNLELPFAKIIKEILCFNDTQNSFTKCTLITFPSNSIQIFYAAMHVVRVINASDQSVVDFLPKDISTNKNVLLLYTFIVGIISSNDMSELEKQIKPLFLSIHNQCSISSAAWAELIEETRYYPAAMYEAVKYMGDEWSFEDREISSTLITMLKNCPPKQLSLTTCVNPRSLTHLQRTLEICSQIKDMSLFLHFYHNFWVEKNDNCDEYFNVFCNNKNQANVESFAGKLSAQAVFRVPASIKRLALHIRPEDITILNDSLKRLKSLVLLYLNFDISESFPAKRVPKLKLPRSNIILYVDLWRVSEDLLTWSCDVLAALSPAYCKVTLRKTKLTYDICKLWLEELRQRRIHVDSLSIGSTVSITGEEVEDLKTVSSSFECLDFKWLVL